MQDLRKQLLKEMCDGDKEAFSNGKHSLRDMSDDELKHFIVDENHGVIYCYVPKVIQTHLHIGCFLDMSGLNSTYLIGFCASVSCQP